MLGIHWPSRNTIYFSRLQLDFRYTVYLESLRGNLMEFYRSTYLWWLILDRVDMLYAKAVRKGYLKHS
ncbi:hypothetical protein BH24ACT22_BH24ACT22_02990 [soil metagenome]